MGLVKEFIILSTLLAGISGYAIYEARIPNGDMVPHPCKPNFHWKAVGHKNYLGGGSRNAFGEDFHAQGLKWTRKLCEMDSDGDGLTNGQELGDPHCTWQEGTIPEITGDAITNPGVCDPWGSPQCKSYNSFVDCSYGELHCPALDEPHVKNMSLRIPRYNIPARETNYICYSFHMPTDKDYHIIGFKADIDNANVLHHIGLMDCSELGRNFFTAADCHDGAGMCSDVYGLWSVGMPGVCLHPDIGYKFGRSTLQVITLEFHYNNPELRTDFWDNSALIIYYTEKLRPHDGAIMLLGQEWLEIPPGRARTETDVLCTGQCTKKLMTAPIYIVEAQNHMHYTGSEQLTQVIRDGQVVATLTDETGYSYDNVRAQKFTTPVEVRPGDDLRVKCVFNSLSRHFTTYIGFGSLDEMCYGILTYYPADAWQGQRMCTVFKDSDEFKCSLLNRENIIQGCDWKRWLNSTDPDTWAMYREVSRSCNAYGSCRAECPEVVARIRQHACMQGDFGEFLRDELSKHPEGLRFVSAINSCECDARQQREGVSEVKAAAETPQQSGDGTRSAASGVMASFFMTVVVSVLSFLA